MKEKTHYKLDDIKKSYVSRGVRFTTHSISVKNVMSLRREYISITGMMWITTRAYISDEYIEQGHSLIMIWLN